MAQLETGRPGGGNKSNRAGAGGPSAEILRGRTDKALELTGCGPNSRAQSGKEPWFWVKAAWLWS